VGRLKKELTKLAGVRVETAEVGKARVAYDESHVTRTDLACAVDAAHFRLIGVRNPAERIPGPGETER
jgi:hypothetical protein